MSQVLPGRFTAQTNEPFVVFLIGFRVNKIWSFSKWIPLFKAMPPMLQTLREHPEKGFIGGKNFFSFPPLTTLLLSYWQTFEDLEKFARSPSELHLSAWQAFNSSVGIDGSLGIWHETYKVDAGKFESVMPICQSLVWVLQSSMCRLLGEKKLLVVLVAKMNPLLLHQKPSKEKSILQFNGV